MSETLQCDTEAGAERAVARAVEVLTAGGLVALPTETVYGLAARADDPRAVERIFRAKGRPSHNPLIVHVPDAAAARLYAGAWPDSAQRLADAHWPGPLSLVLPRGADLADAVTAGGPTVALRAPATPITRRVLSALGLPVAAPSANPSQRVSPTTAEHVRAGLGAAVDLILDAGPCPVGLESAVVDLTTDPPRLLRPGTLSLIDLRRTLPDLVGSAPTAEGPRSSPGLDRRHYAPAARLLLAPPDDLPAAAAAGPRPLGLLLLTDRPALPAEWRRTLGRSPADYARHLFAALHAADAAGCRTLLVECPPDDPAWSAVHDRLRRAAAVE